MPWVTGVLTPPAADTTERGTGNAKVTNRDDMIVSAKNERKLQNRKSCMYRERFKRRTGWMHK